MKYLFALIFGLSLLACNPIEMPNEEEVANQIPENLLDLSIPNDFNFGTTDKVAFKIYAVDNQGNKMKNIPVKLNREIEGELFVLTSGMINNIGIFETEITLDKNIRELVLTTTYVGLPARHILFLNNNEISYTIGAENTTGIVDNDFQGMISNSGNGGELNPSLDDRSPIPYTYMGTYNNQGVPNYLNPVDDVIGQDLLDLINSSFPEGMPVPTNNPQYIANGVVSTIILDNSADIWVTFVHEGAGYRNALGYYSYPTNSPPATENDITNLNIIFPNISYSGSGGGLVSGNKVFLGNFPAGTTVAYFLVTNGWNQGQQIVDPSNEIKYSDKYLNTYTPAPHRAHVALLHDPNREIFLMGMEDITRPGGDKDFNDAVFYVTSNPYSAVNTANMATTVVGGNDTDGDGVNDNNDEYPLDPTAAFSTHSPAQGVYGTLAFEDLYPKKGDYDMNDVVVDYNIVYLKNAANNVSKMHFNLKLRAFGGGYRSGFAFEMPFPSSEVSLVSGNSITESYLNMTPNGLEAGQSNAVVVAFDNSYSLMPSPGGGFVNTEPGTGYINDVDITVEMVFVNPKNEAACGIAPFNPFIMANQQRGYEVHLPDYPPTDLADTSLFGTEDDDSNPAQNKYYKTSNNLPWAIHIPSSFDYPIEKEQISNAYLKFADWATSGGTAFPDWYLPNSGYRNNSKIY